MTRHHEDKAKHMGGEPRISDDTRAHIYFTQGFGVSDIAVKLLGRDDDDTRAEVRGLIAAGRKKALGAH